MDKETEDQETQNAPEVEEPKTKEPEIVVEDSSEEEAPQIDVEDLAKKAEVSSQNFERAKKAENEVKELKAQLASSEVPSQSGDEVLSTLQQDLAELKAKQEQQDVLTTFPQIKDIWEDFEEYQGQPENVGMKTLTAAKAFLTEKGALEEQPKRKGVEKATGGSRKPVGTGATVEKLQQLRKGDSRKYRDMLKKGQIKFK